VAPRPEREDGDPGRLRHFLLRSVVKRYPQRIGQRFPFVQAANYSRLSNDPHALTLSNPWNPVRGTQTGTTSSTGYQYNAHPRYLQSYNLTVERDVGRGAIIELAYVGSKGTHLGRQYNYNTPYRSVANFLAHGTNFPTPVPQLGTGAVNYWDFGTNSIYG